MCLMWKSRQHKLGIDDFGNPLVSEDLEQEDSPIPVTRGPPHGERVHDAVVAAVETDVREEPVTASATAFADHEEDGDEETPLLKRNPPNPGARSWFGWLRR